ncbi:hypothetical protein [Streptoalloteichus hindustanus]|uniref:hypothetical protein n=1 Tax=Streptoalloteichus hindustanus TaxID=2017 RepID=UPI001161548E|nr:hypothetical protein [Streptoalloteichus hindustanus]
MGTQHPATADLAGGADTHSHHQVSASHTGLGDTVGGLTQPVGGLSDAVGAGDLGHHDLGVGL